MQPTRTKPRSQPAFLLIAALLALGLAGCRQAEPLPVSAVVTVVETVVGDMPSPTATEASPVAGDGENSPLSTPTATATAISTQPPSPEVVTGTPEPPPTETVVPTATTAQVQDPPIDTFEVVATYPHDPDAFIQGLVYQDGIFYEGTGLRGRSSLRKVDPASGDVTQGIDLPAQDFGEGIAIFGDKLYQLTWQENTGYIYDKDSFELLDTWTYPGEGWGLTTDGQQLIMSDGTNVLRFLDPSTLAETRRVEVLDPQGRALTNLNELEYVNGEVYANIWQTDWIARIDPATGQIRGLIDLRGLLPAEDRTQPVDVLNGIAYDPASDHLFVTGKLWPKLFEIDLVPVDQE